MLLCVLVYVHVFVVFYKLVFLCQRVTLNLCLLVPTHVDTGAFSARHVCVSVFMPVFAKRQTLSLT